MADSKIVPWYYRPWIVILLLIFVLGPFGLPLVYKSPKFNKVAKVILTLAMVAYSVYLVDVTLRTLQGIRERYPELAVLLG